MICEMLQIAIFYPRGGLNTPATEAVRGLAVGPKSL
jgi:hypothetical protein